VLITGTSSGLGRALALDLAGRGGTVLAGVRRADTAPRVDGSSGVIHEIVLDVTSPRDVETVATRLEAVVPAAGLRAVVNNAGIGVGAPLEFVALDALRDQFEVNVFGQVAVTQALLELLRSHGDGRVVFMSSIAGRTATPFLGPYAASKRAL